jgi:hypothetical protein
MPTLSTAARDVQYVYAFEDVGPLLGAGNGRPVANGVIGVDPTLR